MSADGFLPIFGCLFVKKIQNKVSDCFYEITYYILKILPVTRFREHRTMYSAVLVKYKAGHTHFSRHSPLNHSYSEFQIRGKEMSYRE
jgi:hypothetical protein